ncbi:hypothetical protein BO70DRAFT_30068 [Aspergillus heteromorphus CBS 117.55]|uniref:Uncharacterized protein n=1 Tax=Aspergillus heteromorphus CBS 117.55 TaxID=1448321 RepID=A0A317W9K6_9EURO|nr:uncharacterized protein BO70DRAFT_30068 [Aspergillus heteromorphus CBS 117.55]PWY82839.1 hypothetical protein BO70DRAFT_30068 [Aspergillus heteromorphus CBS 117.55]
MLPCRLMDGARNRGGRKKGPRFLTVIQKEARNGDVQCIVMKQEMMARPEVSTVDRVPMTTVYSPLNKSLNPRLESMERHSARQKFFLSGYQFCNGHGPTSMIHGRHSSKFSISPSFAIDTLEDHKNVGLFCMEGGRQMRELESDYDAEWHRTMDRMMLSKEGGVGTGRKNVV